VQDSRPDIDEDDELSTLASLFVAADHLHRSLSFAAVTRTLRDVLIELIGARSWACFVADGTFPAPPERGRNQNEGARPKLRVCAGEGVALDEREFEVGKAITPLGHLVERTFLTGERYLATGDLREAPRAALPLQIEGRTIGALVVVEFFPQKDALTALDHKLFDLLSVHAASALLSASLHQRAAVRHASKPRA
jgi:hypothetical protein